MLLPAALVFASLLPAQPAAAPKFEIADGDRIVWIGNTLVEREQRYGYWETALHAAFPDKQFTLRNLGWSGDTVFGDARAGFENAAKGFERLVSLTIELKPTVIFVSYGTNESFEGEAGLEKFEKGLEKLLDALKPTKARVVLFSPPPVNSLEMPKSAGDSSARNTALRSYSEAIAKIAKKREHQFADLNKYIGGSYKSLEEIREIIKKQKKDVPDSRFDELRFSENGIHFTEQGYLMGGLAFIISLGRSEFTEKQFSLNSFKFTGKTETELRQAIVEKNQLFFYKWRPQNETYLFGFRKHEQGKNAKEIVEFDPLIAKAEDEIEKLRKKLKD